MTAAWVPVPPVGILAAARHQSTPSFWTLQLWVPTTLSVDLHSADDFARAFASTIRDFPRRQLGLHRRPRKRYRFVPDAVPPARDLSQKAFEGLSGFVAVEIRKLLVSLRLVSVDIASAAENVATPFVGKVSRCYRLGRPSLHGAFSPSVSPSPSGIPAGPLPRRMARPCP